MIPIRDHNPSGIQPRLTQALIAVNIAVFAYTNLILQGAEQDIFLFNWSFIPYRLHFGARPETLVTAMFLHGGWFHLGGNMLFLWIFGDNVEARLGKLGYLAFFLVCGVAAGLAQYQHDPFARTTVLGASGAIAGLLGAYLRFYPKARIDVFFFFVIFWKTIPIPAWVVLGFWIGVQTYSGLTDPMLSDGVAYWEHIGGFATGFLLSLLFKRPSPSNPAEPGLGRSAIPPVPRRP
jgi:membrane associated rhomboid family serine protease